MILRGRDPVRPRLNRRCELADDLTCQLVLHASPTEATAEAFNPATAMNASQTKISKTTKTGKTGKTAQRNKGFPRIAPNKTRTRRARPRNVALYGSLFVYVRQSKRTP